MAVTYRVASVALQAETPAPYEEEGISKDGMPKYGRETAVANWTLQVPSSPVVEERRLEPVRRPHPSDSPPGGRSGEASSYDSELQKTVKTIQREV